MDSNVFVDKKTSTGNYKSVGNFKTAENFKK